MIQTTVIAQSLSDFTCKLWMMRGGTVLILGHVVDDERRNPIEFGSWGHRSRSTLALCIKHCGHYTDYRFSPITFRLHM